MLQKKQKNGLLPQHNHLLSENQNVFLIEFHLISSCFKIFSNLKIILFPLSLTHKHTHTIKEITKHIAYPFLKWISNCNPYQGKIFIQAITFKYSNLENKAISSLIFKWGIILVMAVGSDYILIIFNDSNSQ